MKILITGICGFVGSRLASALKAGRDDLELCGLDNLARPGSETNRTGLKQLGVQLFHGDLRLPSDLDSLPPVDWIIDAAANPSVLAGVDGQSSSRQVVEHNLIGTCHLLEYARRHGAGLILLSTSRVYSIPPLAALPVRSSSAGCFQLDADATLPPGVTMDGIDETFSTAPPVSLYGATKVASETLALEYGAAFDLPVWINRCGVMAGARQFGKADQGIFSFWLHSWRAARPLRYIGFGGTGNQVRDCLHPDDLAKLLWKQLADPTREVPRIVNVSGGILSAMSLAQLSEWCTVRFGAHEVEMGRAENRPFDLPWIVLNAGLASESWGWQPERTTLSILEEIADHAEQHPDWLELV